MDLESADLVCLFLLFFWFGQLSEALRRVLAAQEKRQFSLRYQSSSAFGDFRLEVDSEFSRLKEWGMVLDV